MRHFILIIVLSTMSLLACAEPIQSQSMQPQTTQKKPIPKEIIRLEITVAKISKAKGELLIAIYNKADNWLSTKADQPPFKHVKQAVTSTDDVIVQVDDLPAGSYAISVFQDLNKNLKLDTNFIGFPKEPFGFSGPMGKLGPPKFDKARFTLKQGAKKKINIQMN